MRSLVLALAALCLVAQASQPPGCGSGGCPSPGALEGDADASSLLALHRAAALASQRGRRQQPSAATPLADFAIAFQGGGFRSVSVFTGAIAGLLAGTPGDSVSERLRALLGPFGLIASNSGGSWFSAELLYSGRFNDLLWKLAAAPAAAEANALFMDGWMKLFLNAANVTSSSLYKDCMAVEDALHSSKQELCALVAVAANFRIGSWHEFVELLLNSTAGLAPGLPLSTSQVNDWSVGKTWVVASSTLTAPEYHMLGAYQRAGFLDVDKEYLQYSGTSPSADVPAFFPVQYNVKVGSGDASGPLPFCVRADCANVSLVYEADPACVLSDKSCVKTYASQPLSEVLRPLAADLGSVPLSAAVASSSAFLAHYNVLNYSLWNRPDPFEQLKQRVYSVQLPVWYSSGLAGSTWKPDMQADTLVREDFSQHPLVGFMDGARTDNAGILHAVAAGANTVVAMMGGQMEDVFNLFTCDPSVNQVFGTSAGGPACLPSCGIYFPIFQSPSCTWSAAAEFAAGANVIPSAPGSTVVSNLTYYTYRTTTKANPWVGVEAGRQIELRVVLVQGFESLPIGLAEIGAFDVVESVRGRYVSSVAKGAGFGLHQAMAGPSLFGTMVAETFGLVALGDGNRAAVEDLRRYFQPAPVP